MNKTYKENKRIMDCINLIVDSESLFGKTEKSVSLRDKLEAIAEISFIQGQILTRREVIRSVGYNQEIYNKDVFEEGISKIKSGYNDLQVFLGSNLRLK